MNIVLYFQCLEGQNRDNVDSLIVTASGGPLRTWDSSKIQTATARLLATSYLEYGQ